MDTETPLPNDGQPVELPPSSFEELFELLDDREKQFLIEYLKDKNQTRAVLRCLFTDNVESAAVIGSRMLRNVKVFAAKNAFLSENTLTATQAIKEISDIAQSNLNDYMVVKQVQGRELIPQYATVLIANAREEIERIKQFMKDENLEEKGGGTFKRKIRKIQEQILEWQADVDRWGNDVEILAPGRPVLVERMELDMVALAKDKERGRVKSLQPTEFGYKVEMYPADTNLERILKYHGKLPELNKHELSGPNGGPIRSESNQVRTWTILDHTGGKYVPSPDEDYHKTDQ